MRVFIFQMTVYSSRINCHIELIRQAERVELAHATSYSNGSTQGCSNIAQDVYLVNLLWGFYCGSDRGVSKCKDCATTRSRP